MEKQQVGLINFGDGSGYGDSYGYGYRYGDRNGCTADGHGNGRA